MESVKLIYEKSWEVYQAPTLRIWLFIIALIIFVLSLSSFIDLRKISVKVRVYSLSISFLLMLIITGVIYEYKLNKNNNNVIQNQNYHTIVGNIEHLKINKRGYFMFKVNDNDFELGSLSSNSISEGDRVKINFYYNSQILIKRNIIISIFKIN